jgi:hypothetical protein
MTFNPESSHGNGYPLGLTGATAATRFVGGTASGAPASGTFAIGDFVIDQTGKVYVCTVAGTPGTWVQSGSLPDPTDGQAGVMIPTIPGWVGVNNGFTANRVSLTRFTLPVARTITAMKFRSQTAGTGNIDIGIYNTSSVLLGSSGSTAGKKGASTWQTVTLSASIALAANTVYYAALESDVSDGSYNAVFWNSSSGTGLDQLWGSTIGLAQGMQRDTTFPLPAPIGALAAVAASTPIIGLV